MKINFPYLFRGEQVEIALEADLVSEGSVAVSLAFLKDGKTYLVEPAPTREELTAMCREAAKVAARNEHH